VAALGEGAAGLSAYTVAVGDGDLDESDYAALVARRYRVDHRVRSVSIEDGVNVESIAAIYDEPFADSSSIPTLALCAFTAQRHKVALSGDGGDEVFLGYPWYFSHLRRERIRQVVGDAVLRSAVGAVLPTLSRLQRSGRKVRGYGSLVSLGRDSIAGYVYAQSIRTIDLIEVLDPDVLTSVDGYDTVDFFQDVLKRRQLKTPLAQAQFLDMQMYLAGDILTKVDRASMSVSLEVRVPLLDEDMLKAVLPLGASTIGALGRKALLVNAVRPHLPPEVLDRPKQGFSVPLNEWFRSRLGERLEGALRSDDFGLGVLNRPALQRTLDMHRSGRVNHGPLLWAVLMFDAAGRRLV
jgi:asparagine synthase (glutamine-hydrolysing)